MFDTCSERCSGAAFSELIGRIDNFYEHVRDLLARSEEKLVRYPGGDVDDVAGFDCDFGAALNSAAFISLGAEGCGSITWPPYTRVASPLWKIMTSAFV